MSVNRNYRQLTRMFQLRMTKPKTNAHTVEGIRFAPHFVCLHCLYTHNHPRAYGMEEFVYNYLPKIRKNNPHIDFFVHKGYDSAVETKVFGEFDWGRYRFLLADYKTAEQILAFVESLGWPYNGDFRHWKRAVSTRPIRSLQIHDAQPGMKGYKPMEVISKWNQKHTNDGSE